MQSEDEYRAKKNVLRRIEIMLFHLETEIKIKMTLKEKTKQMEMELKYLTEISEKIKGILK